MTIVRRVLLDLLTTETNVMVYDFGGGTIDVSILTIKDGEFKVKSTAGNTHLGGEDLNNRLVDYFAKEVQRKYKRDLTQDSRALRRLRSSCEQAKRELSTVTEATVEIPSLFQGINFSTNITRARFEELNADIFRGTLDPVKKALEDSRMEESKLDEIILVGGSSRIPKIQKLLQDFFDGKTLNKSINPDEAIAYGAALIAATYNSDVSGDLNSLVLSDVTPLSLGVEVDGIEMSIILERNTTIPAEKTREYTTKYDYQTAITFQIYEGERPLTRDNYLLGTFDLPGIPAAPRGVPKVDVTFRIDENGILNVKAVETSTKKQEKITISKDRSRLNTEEIERLIAEAEKFKIDDGIQRAAFTAKNALESYCLTMIRRTEDELKDRISDSDRNVIVKNCNRIIGWIDVNQLAKIEDIEQKQQEIEHLISTILGERSKPNDNSFGRNENIHNVD